MLAVVHKRRLGPRLVPEVFGTAGRGSCIGSVILMSAQVLFGPSGFSWAC